MEEKINADVRIKLENRERPCDELSFDLGEISDMYENGTLNESEKSLFINTLKQIVEKYDMRSVACVCLFRDIMTADLYGYLLDQLKKCIYVNEALSIRITQLLICDDFTEYYDFLESVKDDYRISNKFREYIQNILDFNNHKTHNLSPPTVYCNKKGDAITIDW